MGPIIRRYFIRRKKSRVSELSGAIKNPPHMVRTKKTRNSYSSMNPTYFVLRISDVLGMGINGKLLFRRLY